MDAGPRRQLVFLDGLLGSEQNRARAVRNLAGHRRGQPAALDQGGQGRHLLQRRVSRAFVGPEAVDLDDLVLEVPGANRRLSPLMAGQRVLLHLLTRDVPLLSDQLRTTELRDLLIAVAVQPALGFVGGRGEPELLADDHGRRDGDLAHVLHATGQDQIRSTGQNRLCAKGNSLLAGTALTVHSDTGHFLWISGGQP